ncbi:MAG: phosphoenolpyruvate carboxylase [Candidatus Marinimicrobia bacterium]|nr:phosphoenolpyruvate carboxylase [Candidatus Neomarinimicrobiota bacterium]MCF7905477.1 phosphoenolpyruvate carboxylase [Candidatus Neomarinimicrobiota bacterium]
MRYQLYDRLFLTLPLDAVQQAGLWMPLIHEACTDGYAEKMDPEAIVADFFRSHLPDLQTDEQIRLLFKVIQYIERQVVLVDALEDAAYEQIHHMDGTGSWRQMAESMDKDQSREELGAILRDIGVRVVLTAHPTQFYPKTILSIISDLAKAIRDNQTSDVRQLLEQLGRTPFAREEAPSPLDEALQLISHLKRVFYPAVGDLLDQVAESGFHDFDQNPELIQIGFWPGGDRDGNPNITQETTRQVAAELKRTILSKYYLDVKDLSRRLSFKGIHEPVMKLRRRLQNDLGRLPANMNKGLKPLELPELKSILKDMEASLVRDHSGLFVDKIQSFQRKVNSFGFHFASLDIRQDSRVIRQTLEAIHAIHPDLFPEDFETYSSERQIEALLNVEGEIDCGLIQDPVLRDTAESVNVIADIQASNGEAGAHRYVISNCRSAVDVARLFALFRLCGWKAAEITVDLVPLFETVADLKTAHDTMETIYKVPVYRKHLEGRDNKQTVMLGFSDGTKDGGYFMANWGIYSAKESITSVSRQAGIEVRFFDGRGGPPARGGGDTHLFYTALGRSVENKQIQTTIQGQVVSATYGIRQAAVHNLELLLTAGIKSRLGHSDKKQLTAEARSMLNELADISYETYRSFKEHPLFIPYLLERSPLEFYGRTNIASRPMRRNQEATFRFEDLRAIPFVGAWSQLKQNVPGFYGLGTALKSLEDRGHLDEMKTLFKEVDLFRAILGNSMQSMSKSNLELTRYMEHDEKFGDFYLQIFNEYELTKSMVLKVAGQSYLLEDNDRSRQSIALRERVVLPLFTIQQYALKKLQSEDLQENERALFGKMVMRTFFGNINATRNSV